MCCRLTSPLSGPDPVAGRNVQGPLAGAFKSMFDGLRRSRRRHQLIETLVALDDHALRDIGLTRGIMVSNTSAERRPRGLYADMIHHRLRQF